MLMETTVSRSGSHKGGFPLVWKLLIENSWLLALRKRLIQNSLKTFLELVLVCLSCMCNVISRKFVVILGSDCRINEVVAISGYLSPCSLVGLLI